VTNSLFNADPLLNELADNGGPTRTHTARIPSPVMDAGSCNGLIEDQRGVARPFDIWHVA